MEFHVIWRSSVGEAAHNVFLSFKALLVWLINTINLNAEIEIIEAYIRMEKEML